MTDTDIRSSVESLGATVGRLTDAVDRQADSQVTLAAQVIESNRRAARDRKMLRILTALMVFKLITLLVLALVIFSLKDTQAAIKDCTTPQGQCAKRGAASTAVFLDTAALKGERERINTELPIARAKGDIPRVNELQPRLDQLNQDIAMAEQQLVAIREGRVKL